eukprot:TRINITY_DN14574_c0_g1_i1.p1 TRINITY_DN14574_c0_g1~~TRINITY_DN14574_c0_g1_i1.p1  ORF type:complete len:411 (+),score=78.84 TRINITY_DN14574_c0_g1_i1:140-1372(+)
MSRLDLSEIRAIDEDKSDEKFINRWKRQSLFHRFHLDQRNARESSWMRRHGKSKREFTAQQKRDLLLWFQSLDADGSGEVSAEELEDPLISTGIVNTAEEVEEMVKRVDIDGSGEFGFDEFVHLLLPPRDAQVTALASQDKRALMKLKDSLDKEASILPMDVIVTSKRRQFLIDAIMGDFRADKTVKRRLHALENVVKRVASEMPKPESEKGPKKRGWRGAQARPSTNELTQRPDKDYHFRRLSHEKKMLYPPAGSVKGDITKGKGSWQVMNNVMHDIFCVPRNKPWLPKNTTSSNVEDAREILEPVVGNHSKSHEGGVPRDSKGGVCSYYSRIADRGRLPKAISPIRANRKSALKYKQNQNPSFAENLELNRPTPIPVGLSFGKDAKNGNNKPQKQGFLPSLRATRRTR